jgi:hypothetical protein
MNMPSRPADCRGGVFTFRLKKDITMGNSVVSGLFFDVIGIGGIGD